MQEQSFEKQVQKKMEELSFTPTDPVWKKIEAEIRIKRDRRRLLFWLPLALLLVGAGVWFMSNKTYHDVSLSKTNISDKPKNKSAIESQSLQENSTTKLPANNDTSVITYDKALTKDEEVELMKKLLDKVPIVNTKPDEQKAKASETTSPLYNNELAGIEKKETKKIKEEQRSENYPVDKSNHLNTANPPGDTIAETIQSSESTTNNTDINTNNTDIKKKESSIDTTTKTIPEIKAPEKDSLSLKEIASKKDNGSKWKLAVTAGSGRSGVSNGVGIFGNAGGEKSLETNAFVADQNYNGGQFSSIPNNAYRPPSAQKKSLSYSLGLLVKKKLGKRSVFSTGLQYNFYSTKMLVGQNMLRDTTAAPTLRVQQFYANSGASFSEYSNRFHFISLPLAFDFQVIKNLPLDFHIGLSVQQLLKTNALLYSASSQIYYNDNSAFNKTHIFSEVGFMYSFFLKKKGVFQLGPELNYDHSKMGKENFKQHLFSYGLTTQFVFGSR